MKFQVICSIIVMISALSQANANRATITSVAEGLVKVFRGLSFRKNINEFLDSSMNLATVNKFLKNMQDTFQYSSTAEETVHRVMKLLDYCDSNPMRIISTSYPEGSTSCSPSAIEFEPTPSTPQPHNSTQDEVWNTLLKKNPGFFLTVTSLSEFPEWGNRIWYGLLLLNLLKIRCYSGDETLKELWYRIPEPEPTDAFDNFTLKELWNTQKLPSIHLPLSGENDPMSATQDVWDRIHYQLLFLHISHAKCEYQGGLSARWRILLPTDNIELNDDTAKRLWDQLTTPTLAQYGDDDIWKKLSTQVYTPVLAQWNLKFSMFADLNTIDGVFY